KLYAAFQRFGYQRNELADRVTWLRTDGDGIALHDDVVAACRLVRHFLDQVLHYDFWRRETPWQPIVAAYGELRHLDRVWLAWKDPYTTKDVPVTQYGTEGDLWGNSRAQFEEIEKERRPQLALERALSVWQRLSNLANMYEELVREWHLPTYLATLLS